MIFTKPLKIIFSVILAIFVLDAGMILVMANWQPEIGKADSAIILGAAINTPALTNRTLTGLKLYEEGKADQLILSGGKIADSDISEAEFMQKVILDNTANPVKYIIEEQSRNTYENINNSRVALIKAGATDSISQDASIIIVSDKFHIARAFLLAKRAGFETVYWSFPDPSYYSTQELHYYYAREFVAMLSYIPKFIFG